MQQASADYTSNGHGSHGRYAQRYTQARQHALDPMHYAQQEAAYSQQPYPQQQQQQQLVYEQDLYAAQRQQQQQQEHYAAGMNSPRSQLLDRLRTHARHASVPAIQTSYMQPMFSPDPTHYPGLQDASLYLPTNAMTDPRMMQEARGQVSYDDMYLQEERRRYMLQQQQKLALMQQMRQQEQLEEMQQREQWMLLQQQMNGLSVRGGYGSPPGTPQVVGPSVQQVSPLTAIVQQQRHASPTTPPTSARKHNRQEAGQPRRQPAGPLELDVLTAQPHLNFAKRARRGATKFLEAGTARRHGASTGLPARQAGGVASGWVPGARALA